MASTEIQFDHHSSLFTIYDAVHKTIDLRYPTGLTIVSLHNSPMVERLRRIKQLGYASHSYPAADHSRYAHALGTMHMMRMILTHLDNEGQITAEIFKDLHKCFPDTFYQRKTAENVEKLYRHMLVSALLQDVGELPYAQATSLIFKPSENLREEVKNSVGFEVKGWSNKDIFTVASIHDEPHAKLLQSMEINLSVLVFLITGYLAKQELSQLRGLHQLRHMIDGVVDADRLDYVFRDAYHTVGELGAPNSVVESLLYYDEIGPVFSDPGPASDFLVLRARLWTTVYSSPQNRFRILLLITLLKGIIEDRECTESLFGRDFRNGLSLRDFQALDDISLIEHITRFYNEGAKDRLRKRAQNAIDLLLGYGIEYQCFWLPSPNDLTQIKQEPVLPDDLFFDTYSNYQDHSLYKPGAIRVKSERYRYLKNPITLEECCGAFSPTLKGSWSALPMPGNILLFIPKNAKSGSWNQILQSIKEGALYSVLKKNDPLLPTIHSDTRNEKGVEGKSIFISFAWSDVSLVKAVADALRRKRRRYYLLYDPYQGLGNDTGSNSIHAVNQAEAILVIVSTNYISRYADPNGNIHKEVIEMTKRYSKNGLKPVFLSADHYEEIRNGLPYEELGYHGIPYVGKPLEDYSISMIEQAVDEVLKIIDFTSISMTKKKRK